MHILYLSANPQWTKDLHLEQELRAVNDTLFWSITHGHVQLETVPEVRRSDVIRYTATRRPNVLHYSGHGKVGALMLSDAHHETDEVATQWLVEALAEREIELIVLNCCWSEDLATELRKVAKVVIGCSDKVPNTQAEKFSPAFYDGLQLGLSVQEAYRNALGDVADHPYQIDGEPEALRAPLLSLSPAAPAPAVASTAESDEDTERSGPPPVPITPAQQLAGFRLRLAEVRDRLPDDIGWGIARIAIAVVAAIGSYFALHYIGAELLGWKMEDPLVQAAGDEGAKVRDLLKLEVVGIALFFAGGTVAQLLSDLWSWFALFRARRALEVASVLPVEEQARALTTGNFERTLTELEDGLGEAA